MLVVCHRRGGRRHEKRKKWERQQTGYLYEKHRLSNMFKKLIFVCV